MSNLVQRTEDADGGSTALSTVYLAEKLNGTFHPFGSLKSHSSSLNGRDVKLNIRCHICEKYTMAEPSQWFG
jgi:hypothetical protein